MPINVPTGPIVVLSSLCSCALFSSSSSSSSCSSSSSFARSPPNFDVKGKRTRGQHHHHQQTERENWLVNACLARSLFFSCAFFSPTMSLFDMPVAHELCYWCSNVVIGMVKKKEEILCAWSVCLDAPPFTEHQTFFSSKVVRCVERKKRKARRMSLNTSCVFRRWQSINSLRMIKLPILYPFVGHFFWFPIEMW